MWMTSCTGSARRILGDLKKSVSWIPGSEEDGWLSGQARGLVAGVTSDGGGVGGDGKARIERMCMSLLMIKNL